MASRSFVVLWLLVTAASAAQPNAPAPLAAPLREIEWGQLNFLHTTDVHGWHAGHLQEPSYGADWGDYVDFARTMKAYADAQGQDLLVVDTGDRIEGNGLYDASEPKGKYTFDINKEQHIDLICSGNHELYKTSSSNNEYLVTVPEYKHNYLASNLDIYDPTTGEQVPLAPRYKKFITKHQDIRILAFGFIYDFTRNSNNTVITPVEEAIEQDWFQDAIRDREVDLFLVIGHAAARGPEFEAIFRAIRKVQWDTPIQFFGGHFHIRDYKKFDSKSYALASGRYMETIGFQSIDGIAVGGKPNAQATPKFSRRYIDNNLYSLYHHSRTNETTFHSEHGQNVSRAIRNARKALDLDQTFGCANRDLWLNRAEYPSKDSLLSWLEESVLPDIIRDEARSGKPRVAITNTGAIRFDIFKGRFTKDHTYIVTPFTSGFRYIKDVPYETALKLLPLLNSGGEIFEESDPALQGRMLGLPEQRTKSMNSARPFALDQHSSLQTSLSSKPALTRGYTTKDDAGDEGDDTVHKPISFYRVPNCIQSIIDAPGQPDADTTVDVVYNEFIEPWILLAFRFLGLEFSVSDTAAYLEGENFTTLLAKWISENWKENCKDLDS